MEKLTILAFLACWANAARVNYADNPFVTCFTNPCITVPGVGKILGTKKESAITSRPIYSYYGVPYGKPTSGDKRFAPPEPADPLNDGSRRFDGSYTTYLLNLYGNLCPQAGLSLKESYVHIMSQATKDMTTEEHSYMKRGIADSLTSGMAGGEDCLHLAVFTPRSPSDIKDGNLPLLPVMFFIHGGGYYMGTYFGMGPKNLLEHDVVLVEIQYRLGPLGFMCLDHPEIAGNMGMLDQVLALDWVQNHIRSFGGDPEQVTIFGESAGSASASYHMLSPKSRDKFTRLIGESGSALAGWAFDREPEKHAKEIASRVGCPTDNLDNLVRCLKYEVSAEAIVAEFMAYMKDERYNGRMGFGGTSPCAQTAGNEIFLDKEPETYLRNGDFSPKPIVMGANKHEGSFVLGVMYNNFIEPHGLIHDEDFLTHDFIPIMLKALGLDDTSGVVYEVIEHDYFNVTDLGNWDAMMPGMINLVGTFFLKAATYEFMKYNSIFGGESYFYSFEYEGEGSLWNLLFPTDAPPLPRGSTHGDELLYLFSTGLFKLSDEDKALSADMAEMWTNFAINGEFKSNKTGVHVPRWTEHEPVYVTINNENGFYNDYIDSWNNPDRLDKRKSRKFD